MSQGLVGTFLSSSSPMFIYTPTVNTSLGSSSVGWQVNGSDDALTYFTTSSSAGVALQFFGTGISLAGSADLPFTIMLDNKTVPQSGPDGSDFYVISDLPQSNHTIVLQTEEADITNAQIVFGGATITTAYNISQVPPTDSTTTYTPDNAALVYEGIWSTLPTGGRQTSTAGSTVSLNFTGFSVTVTGPIGLDGTSGIYLVLLDKEEISLSWTDPISDNSTELFYRAGLDMTEQHTLDIGLVGGSPFAFDSITVFQPGANSTSSPSTSSGSHHKVVKIVVPIVACLAAVILLIATFWMCKRRRQRERVGTLSGPFGARIARVFQRSGNGALEMNNMPSGADAKPPNEAHA